MPGVNDPIAVGNMVRNKAFRTEKPTKVVEIKTVRPYAYGPAETYAVMVNETGDTWKSLVQNIVNAV